MKSRYQFGREARANEAITILLSEVNKAIDKADGALDGDSNDAEHDALFEIREVLANYSTDPNRRTLVHDEHPGYREPKRITCGYCGESYVADGGWHCPHCGGC